MNIILTGALGFFGSRFLMRFKNISTIKIDLIVRDSKIIQNNSYYKSHKIFSSNDLGKINFHEYDYIVHAATNYSNDSFHDNVVFPKEIIDKIKGSRCVFINMDTFFNHELNKSNYLKPYVDNKKIFLNYCENLSEKKEIFFMNLKIFHMYGPNDNPRKFIPTMINKIKKDETIYLTGGDQKRDFIFIDDVLDFFSFIISWEDIHQNYFHNFDIGTSKLISIFDSVNIILNIFESRSAVIRNVIKQYDQGLPDLKANFKFLQNSKIMWRPNTSFYDGILKIKEHQ